LARVLLSGYYGFGNLGDEALLSGLLHGLRARGHQVTVLSADPAGTWALHGVAAVHRVRGVLLALLRHDALVSGGGGLLQDKTSARSLRYYLGLISLAQRLGKRAVVYGQSVGPLSPVGRVAVARALRRVPVAVRDETSRRVLRALDIDAALAADAALLLEASPREPQADAPLLLVPRGGYPEITEGLIYLGQALVSRGQRVAALAIHEAEDGPCVDAMRRELPSLRVLAAASPAEALAQVAGARYVVSGRLHGLILAAVAHLGFSGLVYDPKVAAFLQEAGRPAHALPLDHARLVADVLDPRPLELDKLAVLKGRAEAGLDWLDGALGGGAKKGQRGRG
jgi:polysaccharide pyruvyl transferase CsaB